MLTWGCYVQKTQPEVKVLSRSEKGEEISSDVLSIPHYESYTATDYRLDSLHEESLYYIVTPKYVFGVCVLVGFMFFFGKMFCPSHFYFF
jgi:hypothetical protein